MNDFAGLRLAFFELFSFTLPPWLILSLGALVVALMAVYYFTRMRKRSSAVRFSDIRLMAGARPSPKRMFRQLLPFLRMVAVALLFVALARPRAGTQVEEVTSEGVDIMIVLDVSSSMQAEDFKPNNRLFVAKEEIKKFIEKRKNDRIGLVVFAGSAFTQCPLTLDYSILISFVDQVTYGVVADGTAIGSGIATAVTRLKDSKAKSKVMVLLTDGDNNAGQFDPLTAAETASVYDIKIHTIAVGRSGNVMMPVQDPIFGKRYVYQPMKVDEETLTKIAGITGGKFFRARSGNELENIYTEIDNLEKTKIEFSRHMKYTELFYYFVFGGLLLLVLESTLSHTWLRKLP